MKSYEFLYEHRSITEYNYDVNSIINLISLERAHFSMVICKKQIFYFNNNFIKFYSYTQVMIK